MKRRGENWIEGRFMTSFCPGASRALTEVRRRERSIISGKGPWLPAQLRRLDRMDKLSTGGHALIDYKTSRNLTPKQWEPPRPDDPQLALYAVSAKEEVTAVVFAKVRPGEMRMMGYSRDDKALPRVQKAKAWQPLLRDWKNEAESLGKSFAGARRAIEEDLMTCRYCGLRRLCRV
jgi:RecB family exonuclease